jgi:hypothetical protein
MESNCLIQYKLFPQLNGIPSQKIYQESSLVRLSNRFNSQLIDMASDILFLLYTKHYKEIKDACAQTLFNLKKDYLFI